MISKKGFEVGDLVCTKRTWTADNRKVGLVLSMKEHPVGSWATQMQQRQTVRVHWFADDIIEEWFADSLADVVRKD